VPARVAEPAREDAPAAPPPIAAAMPQAPVVVLTPPPREAPAGALEQPAPRGTRARTAALTAGIALGVGAVALAILAAHTNGAARGERFAIDAHDGHAVAATEARAAYVAAGASAAAWAAWVFLGTGSEPPPAR
jgi:hypothetical protein